MKKFLSLSLLVALAALAGPSPKTGTVVAVAGYDFVANPDVTNIVVYFGPSSGNYTGTIFMGTNLTVSVPNLTRNATYFFAFTAQSSNGTESDYSQELSVKIPNKPQAPIAKSVTAL